MTRRSMGTAVSRGRLGDGAGQRPPGRRGAGGRREARMRRVATFGLLLGLVGWAGCTVGPDYRRPDVAVPAAFRGQAAGAPGGPDSIADLAWWKVFQDEQLQQLIRTALQTSYDVRIAAARVLDAQAQVVITRSFQFPSVNLSGNTVYTRITGDRPPLTAEETFNPAGSLDLSWELDFWGRVRRATEAARAQLLATDEARHAVLTTLVSSVATAYLQLRELDLELEIARRTLTSRQASLRLAQLRAAGGVSSLIDVRQAEVLVITAAQAIPDTERRIEQTENLISILLGRNPDAVPRGRPLAGQIALPSLPPGLPASLLERRPDVRLAEQLLVAANAQIGVAKAAFFPQVILTGSAGVGGSLAGGTLFGPLGLFGIGPQVSLPIFNTGRIQAGVDSAEARQQQASLQYLQVIQQAFREVSDALVGYRRLQEFRIQQQQLTDTLRDAGRLSTLRYRGGVTSYLEVLDTERQLFTAELQLAQAQLNELLAVVQLYRALGGGWQS